MKVLYHRNLELCKTCQPFCFHFHTIAMYKYEFYLVASCVKLNYTNIIWSFEFTRYSLNGFRFIQNLYSYSNSIYIYRQRICVLRRSLLISRTFRLLMNCCNQPLKIWSFAVLILLLKLWVILFLNFLLLMIS